MNLFKKIFPDRLHRYWKKNEKSYKIDDTLRHITNSFIKSKSYKMVSNYWHILSVHNYEVILDKGIKVYGSTVAKNYYTFTEIYDEWIEGSINNLKSYPYNINSLDLFKNHDGLKLKESITYNIICYLTFHNLKKKNSLQHLNKLNDKSFLGFNDPFINIEGFKISTDKVISLLDYEQIQKAYNLKKFKKILEIGAGSGRVCDTILSIEKHLNYIICDIAPALYLSYTRLKLAFPNKKISLLIDVNNKVELEKQIENNDISFIFPHQLEILNGKSVDLILGIDCFHEMDKSINDYYFKLINNISKNFYFSIWELNLLPGSGIFKKTYLEYERGDYNIPNNWKTILKENLVFPSNQISIAFEIID